MTTIEIPVVKTTVVLLDEQGNEVNVGDQILYITHGPYLHYGTVEKIIYHKETWGHNVWGWRVHVRRTWDQYNNNPTQDRVVVLSSPTMFKLGVPLEHPEVEE